MLTPFRITGIAVATTAAFAALTLNAVVSSADSAAGTVFGPAAQLGNGTVRVFVDTGEQGEPENIGLRFTEAALDGLPDGDFLPPTSVTVDLPAEAADTVFEHVMINWNSRGHEPATLFGKPHFDFHFYMTDTHALSAIDPLNPAYLPESMSFPAARYVPQDYVITPGPPAVLQAVPRMGVHWADNTVIGAPGFDFGQVFVNGTWNGDYTFMEPMITRDYLRTKPTVHEDLKLPEAYQRTGLYPTTYSLEFDDDAKEYVITLGGLTMREQS